MKVSHNKVKGISWSWHSCSTFRRARICINKISHFFVIDTIFLTKIVRKYIIVSLLCRKATEYDDTLRAFLLHSTCETNVDVQLQRVYEKCGKSFKEISSFVGLVGIPLQKVVLITVNFHLCCICLYCCIKWGEVTNLGR